MSDHVPNDPIGVGVTEQATDSSAPPQQTRSAGSGRGRWILIGAATLALVLLAVAAVIVLRPLTELDYRRAQVPMAEAGFLNDLPLSNMVLEVGDPLADTGSTGWEDRLDTTIDLIERNRGYVAAALDTRAGKQDEDVRTALEDHAEALSSLDSMLRDWREAGYPRVAKAAYTCTRVPGPECALAAARANRLKARTSQEVGDLLQSCEDFFYGKVSLGEVEKRAEALKQLTEQRWAEVATTQEAALEVLENRLNTP